MVDADSMIEIVICESNKVSPHVSCDGITRDSIAPGGTIRVNKEKTQLNLIHPNDYNYYATLREKLGWERNLKRT